MTRYITPDATVRPEITPRGTTVLVLHCPACDGAIYRLPFGAMLIGREAERMTIRCPHCGQAAVLRL